MVQGDQEPVVRSEPAYQDLVNVDFPQVQEYRQLHSNWSSYQRSDFSSWDLEVKLKKAGNTNEKIRIFAAIVILLLISVAALVASTYTVIHGPYGNVWYFLAGVVGCGLLAAFLMFRLMALDKESSRYEIDSRVRERGPVEAYLLFGRAWLEPRHLRLLKLRQWFWLRWFTEQRAIQDFARKSFVWLDQPSAMINKVRVIWLANGQLQFGCGPKGVVVHYADGPLFLLGWAKVASIYDSEGEFDFEQITAPGGRKVDSGHFAFIEAASLSADAKSVEWARQSVRIRLHRANDKDPADELIIPKRFFGKLQGETTWHDFMAACLKYKHFPEEIPTSGKSVGSIDFPSPATQVQLDGLLERWRQGRAPDQPAEPVQ